MPTGHRLPPRNSKGQFVKTHHKKKGAHKKTGTKTHHHHKK
jgi:hypothetical protein